MASTASPGDLPPAGDDALAHSQGLQQVIRAEIIEHGNHISFARFMHMALYKPGLGYYSAGSRKFGAQGDFTTAPEISALFSACLARQCAEVLALLGNGTILELGAGSGVMARDLLQELQRLDSLPEQYLILETSADLRQRQQQLLHSAVPELAGRVAWLDSLPAEPLQGLILANEVLDAMPVERFRLQQGEILELGVSCQDHAFTWHARPARAPLAEQVESIMRQAAGEFPDAYTSEVNTGLESWLAAVGACLEKGLILFIDYGYSRHEYYHEQRRQGTLLCHYRHRVHADPFINIGLQDITASVDFSAVATAAVRSGLQVSGYTSQAFFLLACGIAEMLQDQVQWSVAQQAEFSRQVKLLTLPGEMGERFKVMALGRHFDAEPLGFSMVDYRRRL